MTAKQSILAIDPGTSVSGWCLLHLSGKIEAGIAPNDQLIYGLNDMGADLLAVEVFEARGMPLGNESIETILYTGRLMQAWGGPLRRVKRSEVKRHLCGSLKAKDSNIRAALIDRFGGEKAN